MSNGVYLAARTAFAKGELSWTEHPIGAQFVSAAYNFDESHTTPDDIEIGAIGDPINVLRCDVADGWCKCLTLTWPSVAGLDRIAGIVFFRYGPNELLIEFHDAIEDLPMPNGGPIIVEIFEPGIFRV